jgi:hypothetical protein
MSIHDKALEQQTLKLCYLYAKAKREGNRSDMKLALMAWHALGNPVLGGKQ